MPVETLDVCIFRGLVVADHFGDMHSHSTPLLLCIVDELYNLFLFGDNWFSQH